MRTKVTLFLVFLNVALFFYIFKFERNWQIERDRVEKGLLVLGPAAANLQSIQITGPALAAPVELRKLAAEGWLLTRPIEWPANPFAVNSLITALERLEHETSFSAEESELAKNRVTLATYGLAEPRLSVSFSTNESGADALSLQIGASTPDGKRLYVLSPDRKWIHVVSNRLAEVLTKPADQFRSDALFSIGATEVKGLNIRAAATQTTNRIERDAANRWQFLAPISTRANDQATLRTVTGLANLRVKSFPPPPPADALTVTLRVTLQGNNRTEILNLGGPVARPAAIPEAGGDTEYYATLETTRNNRSVTSAPFTVVLPAALESLLQKSIQELRERHLFADLDARAVTAITLSGIGAGPLTLQRLETGAGALPSWRVVQGAGAAAANTPAADTAVIERLLVRLTELEAVAFLTEAPSGADVENWGFNQPERTITLALGAGQAPRRLELGFDRDRKVVRARLAGGDSPSIYEVRPEIIEDASLRPLDYRNRLIRELPSGGRITRLRLTQEANAAVLLDQNLADPAAPVPAVVADLLRQLQSLRAESFIADAFGPTVRIDNTDRPWAYKLEMDIALVAGVGSTQTTTTTLMLSERTGGTVQFAGAEEFRAIWRLPQALIDPLWRIISAPTDPGAPGRGP
jgi:hypothetical protein